MKKTVKILLLTIVIQSCNYYSVGAEVFEPNNCDALYSTDLVQELYDQVDSRITGLSTSTGYINIFTSRGDNTGGWSRNTSVWTSIGDVALDLTGVSPWNSTATTTRSGTLISPRHLVFANHFPISNGATVVFVEPNGDVVTRTLTDQTRIGSTDIKVGILDSAVPSTIAFYPVISSDDVNNYLSASTAIPAILLDQEGKALVHNINHIGTNTTYHETVISFPRGRFSETIVGGDSGNPGFIVVGDELVLNFTHYTDLNGPAIGHYISEINSAMTSLGGGEYQVSTFDLSCFATGEISLEPITFSIAENVATSTVIGTIAATELFSGQTPTYSITSGNGDGIFSLGALTGILTVTNPSLLNYDSQTSYSLEVRANSVQVPANLATTTVTVNITRANEYPDFADDSYSFSVVSNAGNGDAVGTIAATDPNVGQTLQYSLISGNTGGAFGIDGASGVITVADRSELEGTFSIIAQVTDNDSSPLSATTSVSINVTRAASSGGGGGGGGGGRRNTPPPSTTPVVVSTPTVIPQVWSLFARDLTVGSEGGDVLALQQFLNANSYVLSTEGPGSPGNESTYFGERLRFALSRFQAANGISPAAGYFGPTTRAFVSSYGMSAIPSNAGYQSVITPNSKPAQHVFSQPMSLGSKGGEVFALQNFLVTQGVLTADNVTGFFGPVTRNAVGIFQIQQGIIASSQDSSYGLVGPTTRAKINAVSQAGG
ncbi:MAG TPA: cadherin domain-containing protein [Candidatus Paceibacterota bacterium]|nr:cadherin domain-containing protein [Candidatus Paceibacterota bacterium]